MEHHMFVWKPAISGGTGVLICSPMHKLEFEQLL
jgi:hypothetical protein